MSPSPLRFAAVFLVLFAVLMGGFEASRGSRFERFLVEDVILRPTVALINVFSPPPPVVLAERTIRSPDGANLRVVRGCEGVEMFVMLLAAVLAFPASAGARVRGLLEGGLLAYALSVLRLAALHGVLRYNAAAWEALHGLVLPLGPVLVLGLYFLHWSGRNAPSGAAVDAG